MPGTWMSRRIQAVIGAKESHSRYQFLFLFGRWFIFVSPLLSPSLPLILPSSPPHSHLSLSSLSLFPPPPPSLAQKKSITFSLYTEVKFDVLLLQVSKLLLDINNISYWCIWFVTVFMVRAYSKNRRWTNDNKSTPSRLELGTSRILDHCFTAVLHRCDSGVMFWIATS